MTDSPLPDSGEAGHASVPAIEVENLSKTFKGAVRPALDRVSLKIPRGVIFGMLGPNGAGKTTLLSILCGLLKPSSGRVRLDGHDMSAETPRIKQVLGMVPQEPAIYPTLTARENLQYFGRMQGITGARLTQRVHECLQMGELEDVADERVEHFSGGFKRRLNLVVGLIHEPQILILDEPTVAIDPHSRAFIHQRLRELHARGVSIVLSTHQMDEAEQLCHHLAIINQGRIIAQGTLDALLQTQRDGCIRMQLKRPPPAGFDAILRRIAGVYAVRVEGARIRVNTEDAGQAVFGIVDALREAGLALVSLSFGTASLEEVFLALTEHPGTP